MAWQPNPRMADLGQFYRAQIESNAKDGSWGGLAKSQSMAFFDAIF